MRKMSYEKKSNNIFVRYGGLNLKKQKGFGKESYHAPPSSIGIYAMPLKAQEMFLIGSLRYQNLFPKKYEESDFEKYHRLFRKVFLKNNGYIWHHLKEYLSPKATIIAEHNDWVKTSINDWNKAFNKMCITLKVEMLGDNVFGYKNIKEVPGICGRYSKDHCEVFFDEKV